MPLSHNNNCYLTALTSCQSNDEIEGDASSGGGGHIEDVYNFDDSNILKNPACLGSHITACTFRMIKSIGK